MARGLALAKTTKTRGARIGTRASPTHADCRGKVFQFRRQLGWTVKNPGLLDQKATGVYAFRVPKGGAGCRGRRAPVPT